MNFENIKHKGISYLMSPVLKEQGIHHGFLGNALNLKVPERESSAARFCEIFNANTLSLLKQNHTDKIQMVDKSQHVYDMEEADAFIIKNYTFFKNQAFGILTADCIPLILLLDGNLALIHSGWRGLVSGIIEKVIKKLQEFSKADVLYAAIGPCAGSQLYEVGKEVIEQLAENAVYKNSGKEKYLLSLVDSASSIINKSFLGKTVISSSDICVISNENFFSYRREGNKAGRNLTFVLL
jgi:YfiH family protein